MKTVLFIPGFKKSPDDHAIVFATIKKRGYAVRSIEIDWSETTIDDWLRQARAVYEEYEPQDVILAGHSLGAVTAFLLAASRNPSALWLFSLSGRFAEDIPRLTAEKLAFLGARVVEAFAQIRFEAVVGKIACETLLFFGSKERGQHPELVFRVEEAHRQLSASTLIEAEGAGHGLNHPAYLRAIAHSI